MGSNWKSDFKNNGFVVFKSVLTASEVEEVAEGFDRVSSKVEELEKSDHGPFTVKRTKVKGRDTVYFVRWPSFVDEKLNQYRMHPNLLKIVFEVLGKNLNQITNQMHFKQPGDGVFFPMHQDAVFRKPDHAYRHLDESFLQTILAVDPSTTENGCIYFYPGSHHPPRNLLLYEGEPSQYDSTNREVLERLGDPVAIELSPGDLVISNAYVVHGSGVNTSQVPRRAYINGFVRSEDTENGIEVTREGKVIDLDPNGTWKWDEIESYRSLD